MNLIIAHSTAKLWLKVVHVFAAASARQNNTCSSETAQKAQPVQTYKRSCSEIRWPVHGSFFQEKTARCRVVCVPERLPTDRRYPKADGKAA